jgi:hypothetical protein
MIPAAASPAPAWHAVHRALQMQCVVQLPQPQVALTVSARRLCLTSATLATLLLYHPACRSLSGNKGLRGCIPAALKGRVSLLDTRAGEYYAEASPGTLRGTLLTGFC